MLKITYKDLLKLKPVEARRKVLEVYFKNSGNISRASRETGVSRKTMDLWRGVTGQTEGSAMAEMMRSFMGPRLKEAGGVDGFIGRASEWLRYYKEEEAFW